MTHPFLFREKCPSCLSTDLIYIDLQDTEHKSIIYPIKSVKCNKCNNEFFIKWEKDNDEDSEMYPYITDKDIMDGFVSNICDYSVKHRRKLI